MHPYGAKRLTVDFDCLVRRDRQNLARLAPAMHEPKAHLRVAGLSDIIASKVFANRSKDHEALPELYAMGDATT